MPSLSCALSITVVDDEEKLAILFDNIIKALGLDSMSFTNSLQALEHFKANLDKFSLLIIDVGMTGMCDLNLADKVRDLNKSDKIFLITAFDNDEPNSNKVYQSAKIDRIIQKLIKLRF